MSQNINYSQDINDYKLPSRFDSEDTILGWGNSAISQGLAFLRAQPAFSDISQGRSIIHAMETYTEEIPAKLSRVRVPRIKRNLREIVAMLSNLRPTWDYVSNDLAKYEGQANVLNKLHKCFSYDTDLLTRGGWKRVGDVTCDDEVATLNPTTNHLEYQHPSRTWDYEYEGEMVWAHSRFVDQLVTPNHRMWVQRKDQPKFEFIEAENCAPSYCFASDAIWNAPDVKTLNINGEIVSGDIWAEFMGFFLAEGHTNTCSEPYKKRYLSGLTQMPGSVADRMLEVTAELPWKFYKRIDNQGLLRLTAGRKDIWQHLAPFGKAKDKYIPREILEMSARQLRIFLKAYVQGDGTRVGTLGTFVGPMGPRSRGLDASQQTKMGGTDVIFTSSERMADDLMEAAFKAGFRPRKYWHDNPQSFSTTKGIWVVSLGDASFRMKAKWEMTVYAGKVYCVTTENGIVYTRRNGKATWSGNSWYYGEEVDRSIRQALQYAATEGTGYLYMTWEKPLRATTGRIKLTPLGATSYIPFQQSMDNKVQNAEVGIVCTEVPVQRARRLYKLPNLQATNTTATNLIQGGGLRGMITNMINSVSPYLAAGGPNRNRNNAINVPTVNIYHLYIKDDSLNETGQPVKMGNFSADGKPLDNFSYVVPSLGDPIPTGRMVPEYTDGQPSLNPMTNEPTLTEETRPAEAADCLMYPNLRLIIMSPDTLIYDGPSMFWHGKIPIVQFRMDDWPWNFLGFSLVRDTWRLEESINSRLRARDDSMNARLNPALAIDSRMSDEFANNFSPRIPGGRIVKPPMVDRPVESVLPVNFYDVPANCDAEIQADEKRLDFLLGISEIDALMQLKQMPQSDSLDKLIGASTALIIDIARNMESAICQLGELWKAMAMEFCTTRERFQLLGEDGLTMEDFDFDPGNMIPSHLDGEDPTKPSRATQSERARQHLDSFRFNIVPNSYTQISAVTRKMMALQLYRDKSFPMSPWDLAETLEINNFGPPPAGCKNMMDRWKAWMEIQAEIQQAMQPQEEGDNPGALGASGRPPSGNAPPRFKQRTDGTQTVTESN